MHMLQLWKASRITRKSGLSQIRVPWKGPKWSPEQIRDVTCDNTPFTVSSRAVITELAEITMREEYDYIQLVKHFRILP